MRNVYLREESKEMEYRKYCLKLGVKPFYRAPYASIYRMLYIVSMLGQLGCYTLGE